MRRRSLLTLGAGGLAFAALGGGRIRAAGLAERIDYVGRYRWHMDDPAFGGWSGIEVLDGGTRFVAISDRSSVIEGRFLRDGAGRIAAVEEGPLRPITLADGRPARMDAEGLAIASDGRVFISEEGRHRVAVSRVAGQGLAFLPPLPKAKDLIRNQSLEALAVDAKGTVYTLPEVSRSRDSIPIYRFRGGTWDIPFTIPRNPDWAPVGADFGPSGRFYLLERGFAGWGGFRNRIRAFTFDEDGATEHPLILETPFRRFGNLEGLSVWLDADGHERFTMISDDNFLPIGLYTDIVEFRSPEPLDPAALVQ